MNKVDKMIFIPAYLVLLLVSLPIILFPEASQVAIGNIQTFIITKLGFLYTWYGLFAIGFILWVSFSKYGKIVLGDKGEKPEFKTFSWASMLFCAGIGAGIIFWGAIEWVYYYKAPPLGVEEGGADGVKVVNLDDDYYEIPFEVMTPETIENVLVAGRCISAEHEALASSRVVAQCFEEGMAAAIAMYMSIKDNIKPRNTNTKKVREMMIERGAIL